MCQLAAEQAKAERGSLQGRLNALASHPNSKQRSELRCTSIVQQVAKTNIESDCAIQQSGNSTRGNSTIANPIYSKTLIWVWVFLLSVGFHNNRRHTLCYGTAAPPPSRSGVWRRKGTNVSQLSVKKAASSSPAASLFPGVTMPSKISCIR